MGWLELALAVIPLVSLIIREFLSANAEAKAQDRKFQLDEAAFRGIVERALTKHLANRARESQGAGNAWDEIDKKNPPTP
jgi:hypothetical protein